MHMKEHIMELDRNYILRPARLRQEARERKNILMYIHLCTYLQVYIYVYHTNKFSNKGTVLADTETLT